MKRRIFLSLFALSPLVLLNFSCSVTYKFNMYSIGDGTSFASDFSFTNQKKENFQKLFYGTDSINDGNYVLFFGCTGKTDTSIYDNTKAQNDYKSGFTDDLPYSVNNSFKYLNHDPNMQPGTNPIWNGTDDEKALLTDVTNITFGTTSDTNVILDATEYWKEQNQPLYNLQFYMNYYSLKEISYSNGMKTLPEGIDDYTFLCSPFYTWTNDDFYNNWYDPNGLQGNHELEQSEWTLWEKRHPIGEYARMDKEAIEYREMINYLWTICPDELGNQGTCEDNTLVLYYYDGVMKDSSNTLSDMKSKLVSIYDHFGPED